MVRKEERMEKRQPTVTRASDLEAEPCSMPSFINPGGCWSSWAICELCVHSMHGGNVLVYSIL